MPSALTPEQFLEDLRNTLPDLKLAKIRRVRTMYGRKLARLRKAFPVSEEISYSGPMDPDEPLDQIRMLEAAIDLCDAQVAVRGRTQEKSVALPSEFGSFHHSPDYASGRLGAKEFTLSPSQRVVIRELHEAWRKGTPDLSHSYLLEKLETNTSRLRDTFKSNQDAWNTLIVSKRKGTVRLTLPDESPT